MRYLKVLLLVLLFFLVMLFFMDNKDAFTATYPLTLDLRVFPPFKTPVPIPCYFLLLAAFLIGGLCTLGMLLWDRLSLSARISMAKLRAAGLERDLNKAQKLHEKDEETIKGLKAEIEALKSAPAALPASDEAKADKA